MGAAQSGGSSLSSGRRVARGVAKGIDGLALEAKSDMSVDAGGDADVGVAEEFLDHDKVDTLFQERGGGRVPEVVKAL
ncbi:hypothetical protein ACVWXU_001948 [Streptomyces sp. TE33382]